MASHVTMTITGVSTNGLVSLAASGVVASCEADEMVSHTFTVTTKPMLPRNVESALLAALVAYWPEALKGGG